jgi:HD superfamily phosphohydrolase
MAWIPELDAVSAARPPVRVPLRGNVPATPRLLRLLDTAPIQRLRGIRQMGQADLVYPGAVHTRFEHSLGTYDLMRRMLAQLVESAATRSPRLHEDDLRCLLVAALCHDVGHYPFSHTLEGIAPLPRHEERTRRILLQDRDLVDVLQQLWRVDPERVAAVVDDAGPLQAKADRRLRELMTGPLNPDRLDYLERDSHHAGVPYGRAIDGERLMGAIAFARDGVRLAVTPKGVSAVETLIFASYLMYREVYWHHTVRAAQAMVRRAVTEALNLRELDLDELADLDDGSALARLRACPNPVTKELLARVAGPGRRLYRRVWSGSLKAAAEGGNPFLQRIAAADYWGQVGACTEACQALGRDVPDHALLVDVAGQGKELFFEVPVVDGNGRTTADPEVSLLAPILSQNFERQAKRVQVLAPPERVAAFRRSLGL